MFNFYLKTDVALNKTKTSMEVFYLSNINLLVIHCCRRNCWNFYCFTSPGFALTPGHERLHITSLLSLTLQRSRAFETVNFQKLKILMRVLTSQSNVRKTQALKFFNEKYFNQGRFLKRLFFLIFNLLKDRTSFFIYKKIL